MADSRKRILFFAKNTVPTKDEHAQARTLEGRVLFRNSNDVPKDGALESCDAVAGSVPKRYADKYDVLEVPDIEPEKEQDDENDVEDILAVFSSTSPDKKPTVAEMSEAMDKDISGADIAEAWKQYKAKD